MIFTRRVAGEQRGGKVDPNFFFKFSLDALDSRRKTLRKYLERAAATIVCSASVFFPPLLFFFLTVKGVPRRGDGGAGREGKEKREVKLKDPHPSLLLLQSLLGKYLTFFF